MCVCVSEREREKVCGCEFARVCVCEFERGGGKITDNISWLLFSNPDDRRLDMDAKALTST